MAVEITEAAIAEELMESLMFGGLASERPDVRIERISGSAFRVDFGEPGAIYAVRVEASDRP